MAAKKKAMPKGRIDGYNYDSDMSFQDAVEMNFKQPARKMAELPQAQVNAFEEATGMPFTNVPKARVVTGDELAMAEAPMQEKEDYAKLAADKQATRGQIEAFDESADAAAMAAPRAKVVSPTEDPKLMSVFKTTMGSEFDPKSKSDMRRLEELRSFMSSKPELEGMSANKIALAFYRKGK